MEASAADVKGVSSGGLNAAASGEAAIVAQDKTARRTGRDPEKNRVVQARYRQRIKVRGRAQTAHVTRA